MTPTQRTLQFYKDRSFQCGIVERWVPNPKAPGGGFRKDLFSIIDVIAVSPEEGIIGIQSTGTDFSGHWKKLTQEKVQESRQWILSGGKLVLISWTKKKNQTKRLVWTPKLREINLTDLLYEERD
jgi:hypothetical protein